LFRFLDINIAINVVEVNFTYMPELPDVEGFKKYLEETSLHKKIQEVKLLAPEMVYRISPRRLKKELLGHRFESAYRHGKYLFAKMENNKSLILHFGMTGFLKRITDKSMIPSHVRLLIHFKNDSLAFDDMRKLGKISFAENISEFLDERALGPDAITLDYQSFRDILLKRKGRIKPILMNQSVVAGIGNIWADEILFQTNIHPTTKIQDLTNRQLKKIFNKMIEVLNAAIAEQIEDTELPGKYLTNERNKHGTCPTCGTPFERIQVGGRTTYYCPQCQV
jgi:formamidopyrimidine-DNA glycosylase